MPRIVRSAAPLIAGLLFAVPAMSEVAPFDTGLFAFPGESPSPGSARAAGLGLADRWLGDEPFDNPATSGSNAVSVSPLIQRVNRQDLRAIASGYDETAGFFDFAGAWGRYSAGPWTFAAYLHQPALRHEENAFTIGDVGAPTPPRDLRTATESREVRAGVSVGLTHGMWSLAAAPEWTKREDHLVYTDASEQPGHGTTTLDFDDQQVGGQAGLRLTLPPERLLGLRVGVAVRYVPEFDFEGLLAQDLDTGSSESPVGIRRESAWEAGGTIEAHLAPSFRLMLGGGGRTATAWEGLGEARHRSGQLSLGGEFHAPGDPWAFRFGFGRESDPGAPESSSGVVGLGAGWTDGGLTIDVGVVRRSLERSNAPTSFDDRIVAGATYAFPSH